MSATGAKFLVADSEHFDGSAVCVNKASVVRKFCLRNEMTYIRGQVIIFIRQYSCIFNVRLTCFNDF